MFTQRQPNRSLNKPHFLPGGSFLPRLLRELLRLSLVFCLALGVAPRIAAGQKDATGEYEVKAAMLYNLTRFVEWPPSAYPGPQAPIQLCILGRDPFGSTLASIVLKQTVNGRPVLIRHSQNDAEIRACHLLYISSSERKTTIQIFATLKGSNVLTVGEMTQFAAHGGMIQFSLEEQQVRFDINLDAVARAGLKISSRLLVLARIIKEQGNNPQSGDSGFPAQPFMAAISDTLFGDGDLDQKSMRVAACFRVSEECPGSRQE